MNDLELPLPLELSARLSGHPLLLLLDIDGTISPIAPRPEYAIVPGTTQGVLNELAAAPDVIVAAITGRGAADGRRIVCVDDAWIIGNHGIELAAPRREPTVRQEVARFEPLMHEAVARARRFCESDGHQGVIVEDKHWTLSVHYRLAHPRIVPELKTEVERIAADLGLNVTHGKEVIEMRPPVALDKGTAALSLAETLGATHAGASLLAAGDDRTDEDMFRALRSHQPRAVTVRVGPESVSQASEAEFRVADTDAMRALLSAVLELRTSGTRR
jgi:trehalose-phosphatase